jgi:uncharacterized membrane protein YfcA
MRPAMAELLVSNTSLQLLALLCAGLAAGYVNVVAGGGSLLTVPLLIFLGLPETVANGTSRVAILTQSISAMYAFARAGKIDGALVRRLSPPAALGALVGAYIAANLPDASFRALFGWVMLACAALVVVNPKLGGRRSEGAPVPQRVASITIPAMFAIGIYAGAIQASVGYLWLAALLLLLRMDLVQANVMKTVMTAVCTVPALAVFVWQGKVDFRIGLALALGQALGAWLGAAATLARGERFIRAMLGFVVLVSGLKLLLG